jgi:hypothetical protein
MGDMPKIRNGESRPVVKRRKTLTNCAKDGLTALSKQAIANIKAAVQGGDVAASVMVLQWIVPKPKPTNGEKFNIAKAIAGLSLGEQLQTITDACLNGEISMEATDMVLGILLKSRKLLESDELEQRLAQLEAIAGYEQLPTTAVDKTNILINEPEDL